MLSLDQIRSRVDALARVIDVSRSLLPTYGYNPSPGWPYVDVDHAYHFVIAERGSVHSRKTTHETDELLYWVLSHAISSMAINYLSDNKAPSARGRRVMMERELDLLGKLNPAWRARTKAELMAILERVPFDDGGSPGLD